MSELLSLEGKVAVITGAARGIGGAIAESFAARGASLILNARSDNERLDAFCSHLRSTYSVPVTGLLGDISEAETSATLVRNAFSEHRRLDIYVNNAGVLLDGLIGMVPQSDIDETIGTNLIGVLHGIQGAARLMKRNAGGSIINISSIIGRFGNQGQMVYASSKAGVIGATLSASKELASANIRVNAIAPGFIDTDMVKQLPTDKFDERIGSIGMQRIGTPDDIANAALFLASDLSTYVTGQVIGVDGGMLV